MEDILENILPSYLALGVPEEVFWDSCPTDLKPYVKANEIKQKIKDEDAWRQGIYIHNAVAVAISQCFSKKSKATYFEKPLHLLNEDKEKEEYREEHATEEEKAKERKQLLVWLQTMQANFELNHEEG